MNAPNFGEGLMDRLWSNDPKTAENRFTHYWERLTILARKHLSRKLAARLDAADVVQSAFRTFFCQSTADGFRIDSSEDLWRLLVQITVCTARALARHHTASMRDVAIEAHGDVEYLLLQAKSVDFGPEETVELGDLIERLLHGLPNLYRDLLQLRLEGHTVVGCAQRLGVSRRTAHRALRLLQKRLTKATEAEQSTNRRNRA